MTVGLEVALFYGGLLYYTLGVTKEEKWAELRLAGGAAALSLWVVMFL